MKKLCNIISLLKPKTVSEEDNLIKVRDNIKDILVTDEVFENQKPAYMYNETQYTEEEYNKMKLEERVAKIEEDINLLQLAFDEFIKSQSSDQSIQLMSIYTQYSAISQMYANMIEKGIFTIDRVPARYKEEVEAVLAENAKNKE